MTTTTLSPVAAPSTRTLTLLRDALLPILLVVEVIFFGLAAPDFLSAANLANVVINSADLALLAAGMTLVVLLAGIDVSVGPMLGVVAWVGATLFVSGLPPLLVVLVSVLLGGALGAVNAGLIVGGRISPIIATLGTAAVFKTVLFLLWDSTDVFAGPVVSLLGSARAGGVPLVGLVVLAVFGIFTYVLRRRVFGRRLFAIGNDAEGARLLGVPVARTSFAAYVLVGALVGVAALIYVGRVGVVQATAGQELTLSAIAAVVVGGTSILGGEGGVLRTLGGLVFIALLQNGVVLMGVPPLWNGVLVGVAVALAVAFDVLTRRTLDKRIGARK